MEFPRSIESMGTENQRIAGSEYRPCGPFGEGRYTYVPVRRPSPSASQLTLAMLALHACALAQDPNLAVARHEELFNTHRSSILLRRGVLSSASNAAWRRPTASSAPSPARPADRAHSTAAARSELVALIIDGVHFAEHVVLAALGIREHPQKHLLGLKEGATENAAACKAGAARRRLQG